MAKFFINRPIFAWVVAIFIIIAGLFSATRLPIEQYPNVSAPQINIRFNYIGATAQTIQDSVISIIEEQMNAVDGVDYMTSSAYSNGRGEISLTFKSGMDEDMAQVDVQNKLSQVESRIPQSVRNTGITVSQSMTNFLLFASLTAKEGSGKTVLDLGDYALRSVKPELQRVEGVGEVQIFGAESAMRIWVDPQKLKSYGLSFSDVNNAVAAQNAQITAGSLGDTPSVQGQEYNSIITIQGQLQNADEFENIVLINRPNGASVRIKDVAVVELGKQGYGFGGRLDGKENLGIGVQLSTSGNAVAAARDIHRKFEQMAEYFPDGIEWHIPYDTSLFIRLSLEKVLHTLIEAVALVFIVMYVFLQNFRYTLIPTIVVPISLLGAVALMAPLGMSINVLTMFAMVLVIGIVVDDAIVVVENVERLMREEKLTPYQAAQKGMSQITGAVVGITLVLISVFVPMAFLSGATGAIYRQFSLVIASSIAFSAFMALSLTPALCATILKPIDHDKEKNIFFRGFDALLKFGIDLYQLWLSKVVRVSYFMVLVFAAIIAGTLYLFQNLKTSFLPVEDQGVMLFTFQLPSGATQERTSNFLRKFENMVLSDKDNVDHAMAIMGFSFMGQGQNMALAPVTLKDWSERKEKGRDAISLAQRYNGQLQAFNEAFAIAITPPAIPSLGTSSGFSFYLQDRNAEGHDALLAARNQMLGMMMQSKILTGVRPSGLEDATQLQLTINRDAAFAQNVPISAISATLATAVGSSYVNDYPNRGRLQRVYVMAAPQARMQKEDILALTVPSTDGKLVPMSELLNAEWIFGAQQVDRYNGYGAMSISGEAAPGFSTGDAMREVEKLAKALPTGFAVAWTGLSLEEQRAGNSQMFLYAFSALAVFLCLAALYESWSIPFAVILVVPLGVLGAVMGNYFRGYDNDIYFKIGMITVMGLSAKNAILIIEFAKDLQASGMNKVRAAVAAAKLRFRPIMMTSFAFIVGVVPLYFATGASSASQRAIGTTVFWGMVIGTSLSIYFVPIFYIIIRRIFKGTSSKDRHFDLKDLHLEK
ncbi:MAG: efflux RND transporter permease subunit [Cardiobacteriaceae bacterium]|nr:efflux RND transporter permease subunit [Cardiobacteriaceae bacterium]